MKKQIVNIILSNMNYNKEYNMWYIKPKKVKVLAKEIVKVIEVGGKR